MAIEYHLDASPVLADRAALDFFAGALGLERRYTDHRAGRDELQASVSTVPAEEDAEMVAMLGGVKAILSITFRQTKNLGDLEDAHVVRDLLTAITRFFEEFPDAKGVFTYNFETILAQRLGDDGIVLDQQLREPGGDNRHGTLDGLLSKYHVHEIDQVLL
jgi:hypothetical protein